MSERKQTNYLVVHCSATPPSMDIGRAEIDRWHREKGWLAIGYHYVIRRDGKLEEGRKPDSCIGAHVEGYNAVSLGVCLVGGIHDATSKKPENNFTSAQFATLADLLTRLKLTYPEAKIVGHCQLNPGKACPSFDVPEFVKTHTL